MEQDELKKKIETQKVGFIDCWFSDSKGTLKVTTLPSNALEELLKGTIFFDGSSIAGFTPIENSDLRLKADPNTYAPLPWTQGEHKSARLICDVIDDSGNLFPLSPRSVLQEVISEAHALGFEAYFGPEPEFFLFKDKRGTLEDDLVYFDAESDEKLPHVKREIMLRHADFGITSEMAHKEVAPSQHEIDFKYADALRTADNILTHKYLVKKIARKHGLEASFMPKPIQGENGTGMHVHFSLFKDGANAFYNPKGGLSETGMHFIGGVLEHVQDLIALLAPTVNSYKRLVPGYEAPVYLGWGERNRSALIRIPAASDPNGTRAELRCPDPSGSPYLALAAILKMGLDGIKNQTDPGPASTANLYSSAEGLHALPGTLGEAVTRLDGSELARELLGPAHKEYVALKQDEWDRYRTAVTDWEIKEYLSGA